jgi:hypothetical protein
MDAVEGGGPFFNRLVDRFRLANTNIARLQLLAADPCTSVSCVFGHVGNGYLVPAGNPCTRFA